MLDRSQQYEALDRAKHGQSLANYSAIFEGFAEKGIPASDITPRQNVFTFNAWKALGRVVKKGEKGVRIVTFVAARKRGDDGETGYRMPRAVTVFHISQTMPLAN